MKRPKSKNHLKNLEKERDRQTETEESHKNTQRQYLIKIVLYIFLTTKRENRKSLATTGKREITRKKHIF